MKLKKLNIISIIFLIWGFAFSQSYTNYTIADGLPSNHIYTILQDYKGFVWFLTDKGMVKYNGSELKQFTTKEGLPNNDIWEAFVTSDYKVWYLSKAPQLGYILNDSVLSFPNEVSNEIINPIFSYQLNNRVYLTGPNTSYQLIDGQWRLIKIGKDKLKVHHPKIESLSLLNNQDPYLYVYDIDSHVIDSFEARSFMINSKRGQVTDSLYFFINDEGYYFLNLNTLHLYRKSFKKQLGKDLVKYARINMVDGSLQITGIGFVGYLDEEFNVVDPFYFPEYINAHFGFMDKSKTIWCATFNNGVYKFPHHKKEVDYMFLGEKIQSLDIIDSVLFISVYDKWFYKYDSKNEKIDLRLNLKGYKYGVRSAKAKNITYYLSHGNVYLEENGEISLQYNYISNKVNNSDKIRELVYYNNHLYGLCAFGLYQLNDETFTVEKEFLQKGTNDILSFNDNLYIATTNGLKMFKNDSIFYKSYNNELFNKSILSLKQLSETEFLINTDGFGAYIANDSTLELLEGTEYISVQDAFVEEESIWLATNRGVLCFEQTDKRYSLKSVIDTRNGLPMNNVNTIALLGQTLFVATDNGLVNIPKDHKYKPLFLDIYIDEVRYNSESLTDSTTKNYTSDNTLNISVSSIDFSEYKNSVNFHYKLMPVQNEWVASYSEMVNYNNLKPNAYKFVVSKNGIEKSFSFIIKPLWWQTLGFRIIVGFVIAMVLLSGFWVLSKRVQNRKNQKIFREKQLAEIQLRALRSQMNPHFVFNSLAAIQYYINENNFEASEMYLIKFSKLIRQFFELSKENEIILKTEIQLLKSYLEIEKLRFKDKLNFQIKVDETLRVEDVKIPAMLLQPIVENAVNHGIFNKIEGGTVSVIFNFIDFKTIEVNIIDDGVGFENTKTISKSHSSSLVIIDRLKYLNQTKKWHITLENKELNPSLKDKGNQAIFIITKLD